MKATEGNGGAPIVLSKAPVEKPVIPRGRTLVPRILFTERPRVGTRITFEWTRRDARLVYHDVEVTGFTEVDIIVLVAPDSVVTWDRLPDAAPQI